MTASADTNPRAILDGTTPLTRTLTLNQHTALSEYFHGLDSDAFPMEDDLFDAFLAATGYPMLTGLVEPMLTGALECALWLGTAYDAESQETEACDLRDRSDDVPAEAREALREEVQTFIRDADYLLITALPLYREHLERAGSTVGEQIGHDFMLTRNGHGTGFWDRGLGVTGDRLSEACKPYGTWGIEQDEDGDLFVMDL